jgi:hypothetical protein
MIVRETKGGALLCYWRRLWTTFFWALLLFGEQRMKMKGQVYKASLQHRALKVVLKNGEYKPQGACLLQAPNPLPRMTFTKRTRLGAEDFLKRSSLYPSLLAALVTDTAPCQA